MLIPMGSVSFVIRHALPAMVGVQAHAQNVELKITISCYFCIRVSARPLVRVPSMETPATRNANLVMPLAAAVLGLHHLSARLVVREGFYFRMDYVCYIARKVIILNQ